MKLDTILSIVRQVLTFGGGFVVAKGWIDSTTLTEAVGAVVALVSVSWSVIHHQSSPASK